MEKKQSTQVLAESLDLEGKRVVDVGCGDGNLTRLMTRHGAKVVGLDPNPAQLDKARAAQPAADEIYSEGVGEELPFQDGSRDIVVFFNSLHHIPMDRQPKALEEAARVLRQGGLVYVCEPLAEGGHFELMKPVHDETAVRAAAQEVIAKAGSVGLEAVSERTFVHSASYAAFDDFRDRVTTINPRCEPGFRGKEPELRAAFDRLGTPSDEGMEFSQPMRVNILTKI